MATQLDELIRLLDLEQIEVNIFRGVSPKASYQRIFGGQVAAQALIAAGRTVPADRVVHSLHAYFLRPGDVNIPVIYEVDRIRDGRSFTTRRVVAIQHGQPIFNMSASFHVTEEGIEHADPMPEVPAPLTLPTFQQMLAGFDRQLDLLPDLRAIDVRYVKTPPWDGADATQPPGSQTEVWMRADGRLPDDPLVHVCVVAFVSDLTLMDAASKGHGLRPWSSAVAMSSLDHAMWFHRPFRADEWFLYTQRSPAARGARGLAIGQIFTGGGDLAVSVVQEGLIRRPRAERPSGSSQTPT